MKKRGPKSKKKSKVSSETYREKILKIISEAQNPLRQTEIVDIFELHRNNNPDTDAEFISRSTIQSAASRELKKLVDNKQILQVDNKRYQIYTRENERQEIRRNIVDIVEFTGLQIYEFSDKVWAIKVAKGSLVEAERLFKQYLEEYCFEVSAIRHMIIIMLTCRKQHREQIKADLTDILKSSKLNTHN